MDGERSIRVSATRGVSLYPLVWGGVVTLVVSCGASALALLDSSSWNIADYLGLWFLAASCILPLSAVQAAFWHVSSRVAYELDSSCIRVIRGSQVIRSWSWGEVSSVRLNGAYGWSDQIRAAGRDAFPRLELWVGDVKVKTPSVLIWGPDAARSAAETVARYAIEVGSGAHGGDGHH